MAAIYSNFYREFYLNTDGFIPTHPLDQTLFPGDFFQIRNGKIILLGNIFKLDLIEEMDLQRGIPLPPSNWQFSSGINTTFSKQGDSYSEKGMPTIQFLSQKLEFAEPGSFSFNGAKPESVRISNWNKFWESLTLKLTQTRYSFRKLYVVTEVATTSDWRLAIANRHDAELELWSDNEDSNWTDLFSISASKMVQTKDLFWHKMEHKRRPCFFKAKKLIVNPQSLDTFIGNLSRNINLQGESAASFFNYEFHESPFSHKRTKELNTETHLLDMLQSTELNAANALQFFSWIDASLDDVELLCRNLD